MGKIKASAGRVTITPPVGIYLIGMERYKAYLSARLPAPLAPQASALVEQTAVELLKGIY